MLGTNGFFGMLVILMQETSRSARSDDHFGGKSGRLVRQVLERFKLTRLGSSRMLQGMAVSPLVCKSSSTICKAGHKYIFIRLKLHTEYKGN